jgi:hypothetical protein
MSCQINYKVLDIIKQHRGYGNAIKRKDLIKLLNISGSGISDREMRNVITELIDLGHLIGTSSKYGYFMIEKNDDFECSVVDLKSKASALYKRACKLKELWETKIGKQCILDFDIGGTK